jgi:hypothetical protein
VAWKLYWVGDSWTASDGWARIRGALDKLIGHGDDAAVLVLYAQETEASQAEGLIESFAHDNLGLLQTQLQAARASAAGPLPVESKP